MKKRAIITIILAGIIMGMSALFLCDKYLMVITTVLSFLFLYKLFDYIANFKTIENKSRVDISFLFIFFVWLFVPMSHILKGNYCCLEHRPRNEWHNLIQDKQINYEFGKNFNDWFNDRFCLRDDLVRFWNQCSILLVHKNSQGFIDGDWLYKYDDNKNDITVDDLNALIKLNSFCNLHGIKLYVLIVPSKNDVYVSKKINVLNNKFNENFLELLNQYNNKINIVYPYNQLVENKNKEYMYFKTEHHWTDNGAFIGYSELMKVIKKDFPNITTQTLNDYNYFENDLVRANFQRGFRVGTTCSALCIPKKQSKKYHKTPYKYFRHKSFNKLSCSTEDISMHTRKEYYYPLGSNYRVVLLGSSQNENLCEFIPFTFKHVKRIRNIFVKDIDGGEWWKIMKYYKKEILEYKPDILVFCITTENAKELHKLFEE